MCSHKWVDTGLHYTFCAYCDADGDWVKGEVVLRKPSKSYPLDLMRFGLPIRYQSHSLVMHYGSPQLHLRDVWVERAADDLSPGKYDVLLVEVSLMNPNRVLVGEDNYHSWHSVTANVPAFEAFLDSLAKS